MKEYIKGMMYSLEFLCTELVVAAEEFYQQKEIVEFERVRLLRKFLCSVSEEEEKKNPFSLPLFLFF